MVENRGLRRGRPNKPIRHGVAAWFAVRRNVKFFTTKKFQKISQKKTENIVKH